MDHEGEGAQANAETAALAARVAELETQVAELQRAVSKGQVQRAWLPQKKISEPVVSALTAPPPPPKFVTAGGSRSLESDIGSKVLSKVAILLLLAGSAWFLKWAFDNRWIGPTGRVLIGLAVGAGLIVWSERFRRTGTPAFSYALKAIGSGVLYLSLWASFQVYHLVPATVALVAMILVTAWNAVLALTQDSRLLAAYALLGGYLTPVLLSTGGNHEVFLLTYLGSIAVAVGVLLAKKPWNLLLLPVVPVTSVFFVVWWVAFSSGASYGMTAGLALMLWAVFAATPLVAVKRDDAIIAVLQPIAAAVFGACTMYSVLCDSGHSAMYAWAAVGFAAVYLGLAQLRRPSLLSAIHLSLALSFLTVAIPLKLTGHGITVGWLAEALAVFALAERVEMEARARAALEWLGIVAMLLGTAGAFAHVNSGGIVRPFVNRDFGTAVGALLMLGVAIVLFAQFADKQAEPSRRRMLAPVAFVLFNLLLLVAMNSQLVMLFEGAVADFAFSGWMAVQGAAMLALGFVRRVALARWTGLLLLLVTILKTVLYDMRTVGTGYRVVSYLALGVLLLVVSYAYQKDWLGLHAAIANDDEVAQ